MAGAAPQAFPLARTVIAHSCAHCTCPDVDDPNPALNRTASGSSETRVGTTLLLPAGSEPSGGTGTSVRHRGPAANGHIQVDVLNVSNRSGVRTDEGEEEDEDDALCVADVVATNLEELYSGRHQKLKLAFDDWKNTFNTFQKRREYKEAQRDAIRNEIYQVLGFYIVFQGVIFTAVAQASVLRCQNWWTSFLLSLLTSLVTIGVVLQKLSEFWALETTIASEKSSAKVLKTRINDVKLTVGPKFFDFKKNAQDGIHKDLIQPGFAVKLYRTMSSTEIFNKTNKSLRLKVGNNLVFTDLTTVPKDGFYKVHVDPNATYQEYLMGKDRNGRPLIISSDDCADNKSITILEDADGHFITVKKSRNSSTAASSTAASSSSVASTSSPSSSSRSPGGSRIWKFLNSFRSSS